MRIAATRPSLTGAAAPPSSLPGREAGAHVVIDPLGYLFFGGRAVWLRELRAELRTRLAADPGCPVIVSGYRLIPWSIERDDQSDMLIEVIELCRELGVTRVDVHSTGREALRVAPLALVSSGDRQ